MLFFYSPLEQFEIVPFYLPFGSSFFFDISLNNATLILGLLSIFVYLLHSYVSVDYTVTGSNLELKKKNFFLIKKKNKKFFLWVFYLILCLFF
jgi:hypothetical protein